MLPEDSDCIFDCEENSLFFKGIITESQNPVCHKRPVHIHTHIHTWKLPSTTSLICHTAAPPEQLGVKHLAQFYSSGGNKGERQCCYFTFTTQIKPMVPRTLLRVTL